MTIIIVRIVSNLVLQLPARQANLFQTSKHRSIRTLSQFRSIKFWAREMVQNLKIGREIATVFRKKFGSPEVGKTLYLPSKERPLFYLVTKENSGELQWKADLSFNVKYSENLREKLQELEVNKIGIPKLYCGLDSLSCSVVRSMMEEVCFITNFCTIFRR